MDNLLRMLVRADTRSTKEISDITGLHLNTIYKLIRPDVVPVDERAWNSINILAGLYGYRARIMIEFEPLENGN